MSIMNIIAQLEKEQMAIVSAKRQVPDFAPGDTVMLRLWKANAAVSKPMKVW
jgi:ribosomal protein L19